ncbi:MAG TPA: hypothetical protein VN442_14220 [Bryobacteraceae bacterium]|nr:hypothetical protein [Bryobacteraceae bacterium]
MSFIDDVKRSMEWAQAEMHAAQADAEREKNRADTLALELAAKRERREKAEAELAEERRQLGERLSPVERRWSEICEHLDAHIEGRATYSRDTLMRMLGELNALYIVTQYAGSNARTGWIMAADQYCSSIERGAAIDQARRGGDA